jgi:hypothetical protein
MVSDTLFEAAEEITRMMADVGQHYSDAEKAMIDAVTNHMRTVQNYLDMPPAITGTKQETVA